MKTRNYVNSIRFEVATVYFNHTRTHGTQAHLLNTISLFDHR